MRTRTVVLFASLLVTSAVAGAQIQPPQGQPRVKGQWLGPFALGGLINDPGLVDPGLWADPGDPETAPKVWAEITDTLVLGPPRASKVLLWCRRDLPSAGHNENSDGQPVLPSPQYTFLWDPGNPSALEPILVPGAENGDRELFCGFKVQTAAGDVFATAGVDALHWVTQPPESTPPVPPTFEHIGSGGTIRGTNRTFVLQNRTGPAQPASWSEQLAMAIHRYYPGGFRDHDGRIVVVGGREYDALADLEDGSGHSRETATIGVDAQGVSEVLAWDSAGGSGQAGDPVLVPINRPSQEDCATGHPKYAANAYPLLTLLGGLGFNSEMVEQRPQAFRTARSHSFLQFDECVGAGAPGAVDRFHRFEADDFPSGPPFYTESPPLYAANSVHILYFDDLDFPINNTPKEVVYAFGGSQFGETEVVCSPFATSNQVWRMRDPSYAVPTEWETDLGSPGSPPVPGAFNMHHTRQMSVAVILLNGKIVVLGGYGWDDAAGACVARHEPEVFRPEELYPAPYPNGKRWRLMASHLDPRTYHSSAVLDEWGRVHSFGGIGVVAGLVEPHPAWHSVETFLPPELFRAEPRPRLDSVPDPEVTGIGYNADFDIDATLWTVHAVDDFWVALLAPGSSTHAVDFNQRYVMLKARSIEQGDPSQPALIALRAPESPTVAPPGWYMLTIVDKNRTPSVAKWVRIGT